MSIYPCQVHGARIRGPLDAIYLTLLSSDGRYSRRLRVCPADHLELLAKYEREWSLATDEGPAGDNTMCCACGQTPERGSRVDVFFATSYRKGQDAAEYYAEYCPSCGVDLRDTLGLKLS